MKKISKLKLNVLSEQNLEKRGMSQIVGGENNCGCACAYANSGGSSSSSNRSANKTYGYGSDGRYDSYFFWRG